MRVRDHVREVKDRAELTHIPQRESESKKFNKRINGEEMMSKSKSNVSTRIHSTDNLLGRKLSGHSSTS